MLEKNKCYTAEITGLSSEGSGVCHIDGIAVFVPDSAVGDVLSVKIVKVLSKYAFGIIDSIISPSPDRIPPDCPVYKQCGGCVYRHISYDAECIAKNTAVQDAFRRIGGLDPVFDPFLSAEDTSRYRNKAQFPVASVDGKAVCGFYAQRSHRVIPVTDCPLQPDIFSRISATVLDYINEKKLSVYNESSGNGIIRHIYLRRGAHSGCIMVCLVVRKDISRQLSALCSRLTNLFPDINSIIMNVNPDRTNVILGNKCITLWGSDSISDSMCGNTIEISPLSFYQVNTLQAERLYSKALEYAQLSGSETLADLYCGAGTIGLSMAKFAKNIIGIEIVPDAVENAMHNAAANNISNAQFFSGDAGKIFDSLYRNGSSADVIVLDPPRKGCSVESLSAVVNAAPDRIVMISCNPATAARDAKWLADHGYTTNRVCGADLFPRTRHVECVVLMSRKK